MSEWLSNRARQRRGRPKQWADVIGVTHHTIHQRFKTNAAWTADDLARLMIADPDFEQDFQRKLKEMRACISG